MLKNSTWDVYIIEAMSGKLYTGITKDIEKRFKDHLNYKKGARFFRFSCPKKILFRETFSSRSEAMQKELQIKKMSRTQKFDLISKKNILTLELVSKKCPDCGSQ